MFKNTIAMFKMKTILFLSGESAAVSNVFEKIIEDNWISIEHSYCEIDIETDNYIVKVWDSNKWYAWLTEGFVKNKMNGKIIKWTKGRPSKWLMWEFDKKINQFYKDKF